MVKGHIFDKLRVAISLQLRLTLISKRDTDLELYLKNNVADIKHYLQREIKAVNHEILNDISDTKKLG